MKQALITGVFGQDGSYLAELLAGAGYRVHGIGRREPSPHGEALRRHLHRKGVEPVLHPCDLLNAAEVRDLLGRVRPEECYHLAATHYSAEVLPAEQATVDRRLFADNVLSALNLLSAVREASPETRLVLAGSCLMYDACARSPQSEADAWCSRSVYGLSKITGAQLVELFRSQYGVAASVAVLYNHESPRRGDQFVTRKVVKGLVAVRQGRAPCLEIGNLTGIRDWGYARDYVRGMWLMAQAPTATDYILATGTGRSVEDLVREVAGVLGFSDYRAVVRVKGNVTRGPEPVSLVGDPARARVDLGWDHSLGFRDLVELMVDNELRGDLD